MENKNDKASAILQIIISLYSNCHMQFIFVSIVNVQFGSYYEHVQRADLSEIRQLCTCTLHL